MCPQRVRPGSRPSPPARGRPEGVRAPDGRVRRRAVRARTRTVQRREDRATEDRAAAAACTPKSGGRPRCSGTVIASNQNLAAPQGKWPGALWPQAPALCDPGCAGRPPRPLRAPRPRRGCGSLSQASGGSVTVLEGSRSRFSALGTGAMVKGGPRRP